MFLRIQSKFVEGFEALGGRQPAISVNWFRAYARNEPWYQCAQRDRRTLVQRGYAAHGGGPGVMEAANRGAWEAVSPVGLGIEPLHEQGMNQWINRA